MAHPDIRLSTFERVQYLWLVPIVLCKTILSTLTAVLTTRRVANLRRTFGCSFLRHWTHTLSFRQVCVFDVPTATTIRRFCAANNLAHTTIPVPVPPAADTASSFHAAPVPPATLHLITPPSAASSSRPAARTLLYLHGGGMAHPINDQGQLALMLRCCAAAGAGSLAVLEYGLAPAHRYPTQPAQALAALRALLAGGDRAPESVVVLGDSAGGTLALALLASLREGRGPRGEDVRGWFAERRRLAAVVAVSPWCGLGVGAESYGRNAGWDFLSAEVMGGFVEAWGPRVGEVYGDMLGAAERDDGMGEVFWRGVCGGEERVVERTLVTVGTREVFLDDVTEMARLMGAAEGADGRVKFVKCADEVHVGAVVDVALGIEGGDMLEAILTFLKGL
ncbi:Glycoside hydrolase family 61 [Neofusicoccum parvum]|uniref:Glycoside hydrolase family 61 n=1 Tax=Neofusicoccum parvum TaxID=310453 RepID=A0ACB5RN77_9PEZI|nr:Glycoside hydrolase family 61 [Neofusicoccum parvum]